MRNPYRPDGSHDDSFASRRHRHAREDAALGSGIQSRTVKLRIRSASRSGVVLEGSPRQDGGTVIAGNIDCGLRQIEQGLAWHYKTYATEQAVSDRDSYAQSDGATRISGIGLCDDTTPVEPLEIEPR